MYHNLTDARGSRYWQVYAVVRAPIYILLALTVPVVATTDGAVRWCRPLKALHGATVPLFVVVGGHLAFRNEPFHLETVHGTSFPVIGVAAIVRAFAHTLV